MVRTPAVTRVAAIASALMIAQQVAGKATRDALYLSNLSATTLPPMMGVSAVASLLAALWLSRMFTRYTPARVVPFGFGAGSASLLAIWGLTFFAPRLSAVTLYLYTGVFSTAMIAAFWALIDETFDPHTSRRAVTSITSGGALGGLLGGLAAWWLSSLITVPMMLPGLAAANALCMWATSGLKPSDVRPRVLAAGVSERELVFPLRVLRDAPYLRNLAAIVALGAVTQGLLDYVFNVEAAKTFAKGPALLSFFAMFWVVVGALSFVRQLVFGRLVLRKLGPALSMALLPATVLLTGAVALAVPGLPSASALRGGEAMNRNSFFRAAYEMLYMPVSKSRRRAVKTVIDIGFDRLGTMAAAGLAWVVVSLARPHATTALVVLAMVCALIALVRSRPMHIGYLPALEASLRRSVEGSTLSVAAQPASVAAVTPAREGVTAQDLRAPTSTDAEHVRRALSTEEPLRRTTVAFAILGLADEQLREAAIRALRRVAPLITGQLADALCDPGVDPAIRGQVARILSACATPEVAEALLRGAGDARFDVRFECVLALLEITKANPAIEILRERVMGIVRTQVSFDRLLRERVDRSLEHVLNVLALTLDRGPLAIAFRALHSGDDGLRGTALEYLETALPDEIRDAVWPYFAAPGLLSA